MLIRNKHKTFTLIEMLIVIVIIGILAAALVPRLQSVQARARDTRRVTDTTQIYNALNIYYLDKGYAPAGGVFYGGNDFGGFDFSSQSGGVIGRPLFLQFLVTDNILTSVPVDPINDGTTASYAYLYHCYQGPALFGVSFRYFKEQNGPTQIYVTSTGQTTDGVMSKCQ